MKFIGFIVASIISVAYGGFVVSVLWEWHIVSLGVMEISIGQSIGIYAIISLMTKNVSTDELKEGDAFKAFIGGFTLTSVFFLYGYIGTFFY